MAKDKGLILYFLVFSLCCSAQEGVGNPGNYNLPEYTVKDCFKDRKYVAGFKSDSIKRNYVLKGQQIWRTVSLNDPQNAVLFNSGNACVEVGLFEVIKFGLFEKHLRAFSGEEFSNAGVTLMKPESVVKAITLKDSVIIKSFDAEGNEIEQFRSARKYLQGSDIKSYLIKEDWILNSYTGKTEKYTIAIAPIVFDEKSGKNIPLFWLYYPEWKCLFASFEAKNFYSHESVSFDDVFTRKYFISRISRETNVFDRGLKATYHGEDVNLESERIKEKLRNAESDLFEH